MNKLETATRIVQEHQEKIRAKKQRLLNEWIKSKIGKTFVYRNNSYGSGRPTWDVFKIVLKHTDDNLALVETWELIDPEKQQFKILRQIDFVYDWNLEKDKIKDWNGYPPCSLKEFESNKKKIMNLILNKTTGGSK